MVIFFFVRDNGIGIPPDQHEKVIQLFYKIYNKSEGSSAGLTIVKRIVEVHGGRIWIESGGKREKGLHSALHYRWVRRTKDERKSLRPDLILLDLRLPYSNLMIR